MAIRLSDPPPARLAAINDPNYSRKEVAPNEVAPNGKNDHAFEAPAPELRFATAPGDVVAKDSKAALINPRQPSPTLSSATEAAPEIKTKVLGLAGISQTNGNAHIGRKEIVTEGIQAPRLRIDYLESDLITLVRDGKAAFVIERHEGAQVFRYAICREFQNTFIVFPSELQKDYDNRGIEIPLSHFPDLQRIARNEFGESPEFIVFHLSGDLAERVYQCQMATIKRAGIVNPADQAADQAKAYTLVILRCNGDEVSIAGSILGQGGEIETAAHVRQQ